MDDLIRRQDAIDAVRHAWAKGLEPTQYIEAIPTAYDVDEVVMQVQKLPFRTAGLHMQVINTIRKGGVPHD